VASTSGQSFTLAHVRLEGTFADLPYRSTAPSNGTVNRNMEHLLIAKS
jgi:hypothetical protein